MILAQTIYLSFCSDHFDPAVDLDEILKISRQNNMRTGITGMLLYRSGVFLQFLEGPKPEVHTLLDTIKKDPRHSHFKLLLLRDSDHQLFADWEMAFQNLDDVGFDMVNAVLSWNTILEKAKTQSRVSDEMLVDMFLGLKATVLKAS